MKRIFQAINFAIVAILIACIRFYQRGISPLLGPKCKYFPSCSSYFVQALQKHGVIIGSAKGVWRILRCNPFSKGGYDPP